MDKKIAITGIGVLSPIGIGREEFWLGLREGRMGFREITLFDTSPYAVKIAGEISDFNPEVFLGKKGLRELDRSTKLLCSAAKLALDDAHLSITDDNSDRVGVSIGATFGSLHSISQFDRVGLTEGPRYVNPSHFPNTVINGPASRVSIRFGIKGFNTTISTGCCSALDAVMYACDFIELQKANTVLAGGVEELCEETFLSFHDLLHLSGTNGSSPICCPYDARRNGLILAEGSAVLVLEDSAYASLRGSTILAMVKGIGNAFDASVKPGFVNGGAGLRNAILHALRDAGLTPGDIDYISSFANSSKGLDRMETFVIKEVFGKYAYEIPVSSVKSMVGECLSASGCLSMASAVGVLNNGIIPPTANYQERDPACDLDYVSGAARHKNVRNALVISSDPLGNNSAVVIEKYEN